MLCMALCNAFCVFMQSPKQLDFPTIARYVLSVFPYALSNFQSFIYITTSRNERDFGDYDKMKGRKVTLKDRLEMNRLVKKEAGDMTVMRKKGKYKHLTLEKRYVIENMLKEKFHKREIARAIGCSLATVYNEINRAKYMHTIDYYDVVRYAPETAHDKYRANLKKKGRQPKLAADSVQRDALEQLMIEKRYSPAAAMQQLRRNGESFESPVQSVNTIYSAIKKGLFPSLRLEHLPDGGRHGKKRKKKVQRAKRASKGTSIEMRPEEINKREEFGHWEMDTVKGKATNRKCLLVLTERLSRREIIEPLKANTTAEVVRALNRIEKMYGSRFFTLFKSITVDNGTEFSDYIGMEKALYRVGKRTKVYYCHSYCSYERGSNEVNNKPIRRFFPKGADFDAIVNKKDVKETEKWMNEMPRLLLGWRSAEEVFKEYAAGKFPGG